MEIQNSPTGPGTTFASRSHTVSHRRIFEIVGLAAFLTTAAEVFYLVAWGMWLFPAGSWAGKLVWTMTCGMAMGAIIGAGTLLWAERATDTWTAFWRAFVVLIAVGGYCSWLCSRIDARFDYFGGVENSALFIASGVIPAVLGGLLYSWLLYGRNHSVST